MASLPMVGEELAGYRLRAVLGRGGMSVVYQAENPRLGSVVALKVMTPELAANDVFRARFLQESRIAASLNHPNVIPIFDTGQHDGLLYLAMRYVEGADLRAVLKEQGRISPSQALLLIGQVARALDAAHRRGLVHRDVKPANILVERGGDTEDPDHVYLADFGITKHALSRSGLTATGEFLGTIDYVAPEQIQGKPVDARADVYSLGCVLYECITGRVPFVKDLDAAVIFAHVEESPAPPSTVRADLPPELDDVIARALAKEPADRYPACRDLTEAARAAVGGTGSGAVTVLKAVSPAVGTAPRDQFRYSPPERTATPARTGPAGTGPPPQPPAAPPARPRRGRLITLAAAGAVALILIAAAGVWALTRPGSGRAGAQMAAHHSPATPLLRALAATNETTGAKGKLPPRSCHAAGMSMVTCTNPAFAVESVTFRTYPSLKALYSAYTAELATLGDKPLRTNYGNCSDAQTSGEVAWNHDFRHFRSIPLRAMSAGMVSDNQAVGRVFCSFTNSGFQMVWTQNDGNLLGIMTGGSHQDAYDWWVDVHHNIAPPGTKPMHM